MALIMAALHGILMMGVLALTYSYYENIPEGYDVHIENVRTLVYIGVLGISVLWAVGIAIFGCAMGMAAGSFWDSVRLALIVGVAHSIARLWPYVFTFSGGAFLNHAENWVVIVSFLLGLLCLAIQMFMNFMDQA